MKFSGSNHSKWDDFFMYKLHEQEGWLSLISVLRVSCLAVFLRCCSYMRKAQVNFFRCKRLHDLWQRIQIQIKLKIALEISGYWVSLLGKETRNSCHSWHTRSNTFPLDNQRASAWNITSLCLLSCLCTLLKTFDASLNVRGWIS